MSMDHVHAWYPRRLEKGICILGIRVAVSWEPRSSVRTSWLVTTEPTLQPYPLCF